MAGHPASCHTPNNLQIWTTFKRHICTFFCDLQIYKQAVDLWRALPGGLTPASFHLLRHCCELLLLLKQWEEARSMAVVRVYI